MRRYLSRLTIIYLLCVALLAGWGLDDLVRRRRRAAEWRRHRGGGRRPGAVAPGRRGRHPGTSLHYLHRAIDIAWLFASAPSRTPRTSPDRPPDRVGGLAHGGRVRRCLLLLLRLARVLGARAFALLAIALVVGDLFQAGMGYNPAIPQSDATQPVTGAISYLQHIGPARYVGVTPYNTTVPLPPDVNLRYGLTDLRGYDLPVISRFATFWARYVAPPRRCLPEDTPSVPLTVYNTWPPPPCGSSPSSGCATSSSRSTSRPQHPGLTVAYDGPDATIYANAGPCRAPGWSAQEVLASPGAQLTGSAPPGFHPRQAVVTGTGCPAWPRRSTAARRGRHASPPTAPSGWPSPPTRPARASWSFPTPGTRGGRRR